MQKTNLLLLSIMTALLVSSAFCTLAAAQETGDTSSDSVPPDPTTLPDKDHTADSDNSTTTTPDDQTYHILDEDTPLIAPAPGSEAKNGDLATDSPNYGTVALVVGGVLAVTVGCVLGLVFYRKQANKTQV
ncbi:MAG: hypothetical protein ACQCN6_09145 [Candidatus Bathyarchaeia archaeon]|jgi:hypothetical protein